MNYKLYYRFIVGYLIVFVLYNAIIWVYFTSKFQEPQQYGIGDLARMGYMPWVRSVTVPDPLVTKKHIEIEAYSGQAIDMLTVGDSFSNGGGGTYYQDYIASLNRISVLNVEPYRDIDFVSQIAIYLNNGFLDHVRPRYLLLSSSEKYCVERFSRQVDFDRNISMSELATKKKFGFQRGHNPDIEAPLTVKGMMKFINEGNFKLLEYLILYRFSDHAFFSKVYRMPLSTALFSGDYDTTLLFYRDDLRNISYSTAEAVRAMNDNLNRLADRLALKGITLVFMPVVDKYNLYRPLIVENRYPVNALFDLLRPLPRRYQLIDTKRILTEEVQAGEKDLFLVNDTHWSWKAPKKIFESVLFR